MASAKSVLERMIAAMNRGSDAAKRAVLKANGLSPLLHPAMGRVPLVFEPKGLGGATGRGVEPST